MALHRTLRGIAALALTAVAAGTALHAHALGQLADIVIVDRTTGATLPTFSYRGEYWVAGRPGASYAVEVRNRSGQRILAVPAVDGVNVLTGETAGWDQSGYVLAPGQRYQITGWRKSNSEVAAFEFTDSSRSYAERTGRPANVGVIGVALFRERHPVAIAPTTPFPPSVPMPRLAPWPSSAAERQKSEAPSAAQAPAVPAPSAAARDSVSGAAAATGSLAENRAAAAPKLGTGHGARETSVVSSTQFERLEPQPQEVVRIRYDSRENLVAMGVIRERQMPGPNPDAFPGSPNAGYVPDPPIWR